jgi:dihydrofolate reductase
MSRPICSVFIAASLDGYIARSDGRVDWLSRFEALGNDYYGYQAFFDSVDALVVGRGTYDTVRALDPWPYGDKRCVILTHHPVPPKHREQFMSGAPAAVVEQLGREGTRRAYIDGGQVIRQFLAAGLIDDLTLSVIPVILGSGIRLFESGLPERWLELESSKSWPNGLTQLRYRLGAGAERT